MPFGAAEDAWNNNPAAAGELKPAAPLAPLTGKAFKEDLAANKPKFGTFVNRCNSMQPSNSW